MKILEHKTTWRVAVMRQVFLFAKKFNTHRHTHTPLEDISFNETKNALGKKKIERIVVIYYYY